jgi:DNA (cytosine-5)-methyltransferase 1
MTLFSFEICAGGGGQALGLETAGFEPAALVEIDHHCCNTLRLNRPHWEVLENDIKHVNGKAYQGVDLLSGGVPCPPFSKAGKQLGGQDERDLFPEALRLTDEIRPKAVMLENVRGFLDAVFEDYRIHLKKQFEKMGYVADWRLMNASDYGVSQLRPRVVVIALRKEYANSFSWPTASQRNPKSVGALLKDLMMDRGWLGTESWAKRADDIAPTIVGGSKKHGGPDLGPTRAKKAWASLGVDGKGLADLPPDRDFVGMPKLTIRMVSRIQGFPDHWQFSGKKTPAYRQVGNAFPPPVANAVARELLQCLNQKHIFAVA